MKAPTWLTKIIVIVTIMAFLAACAPQQAAAPEATEAPKAARYALLMSHMTNAFTLEMSEAVQSKAKELGLDMTVYDATQDASKQAGQLESAVTQGFACAIIEPVSVDGLVPAIEAATKAGVPVVVINQAISKPEVASSFVGVSNVDGGVLEMKTAAEALGGKGNVAFLLGPMGSDAQVGRTEGYNQVLKDYPDIKVVFEGSANWNTDEALALVETWLQSGTQIDAIVSNNDGMAMGALKAVEDAGMLDKIKIYGLDANPDALQAVKDGKLAATISQGTSAQGYKGVETCAALAKGEKVDAQILLPFILIDSSNVDEYLK